ncbi:hypothetical protein D3C71_1994750 [compost metagenome]
MFAEGIEDRLHEAPQKFRQLDGVKFHPNPSLSAFRQKSQHRKHKLFAQAAVCSPCQLAAVHRHVASFAP